MAHAAWKGRLQAYAEGTLRWPLTWLVEAHTKRCPDCRKELRAELALWRQMDRFLLQPGEIVRTVALATQRELRAGYKPSRTRGFSLMLAGSAALLLILALLPAGFNGWFSPGVTVVAASSWSEGVATSVAVVEGVESTGSLLTNSSGVGRGTGVAVPVALSEERGG